MATATKFLLLVSWVLSLCGKSLAGISWKCPTEGMISSDFGCYLFHTGQQTFDEAESYCWAIGASLLWVNGQDEMIFLAGQALQMPQVTAWLTGLHSKSIEKDLTRYHWSSGHKVTFTAWSDLEPDHYGNERCVAMELKFGYRWATVSCDGRRSFICKSDPPFFRLKNPILLGVLGAVSILLMILIFILCTMRNRQYSTPDDHDYSKERSRNNFTLNRVPSQPSAPPVDDRYTTLPTLPPTGNGTAAAAATTAPPYEQACQTKSNEPLDHIYEDVEGQRRMNKSNETDTLKNPHPTNPYLMWN